MNLKKTVFGDPKVPPTFHGIIDGQGNFHQMGPDEDHGMKLVQLKANPKESIKLGSGGMANVTIHEKVLNNFNHPAMKTLREIIARHPQINDLAIHRVPQGKQEWDATLHSMNAKHFAAYGFHEPMAASEKLNYNIYFKSLSKSLHKAEIAPNPRDYYHIYQNGTRLTSEPLHIDHIQKKLFGGKSKEQIAKLGYGLVPVSSYGKWTQAPTAIPKPPVKP